MMAPPPDSRAEQPQLAAYDRAAAYGLLRDSTPKRLAAELQARRFGARLAPIELVELEEHLSAWSQRALADMPLRDAMLVDERRGRRVFSLICAELTSARAPAPAELGALLPDGPAAIPASADALGRSPELAALRERAEGEGLALALQSDPDEFPFPDDLATLRPALPQRGRPAGPPFEQPSGWRRQLAFLLAAAGVVSLAVPLLGGHIPEHPAGLPLALLTLALLVGIRAGWAGYVGAACIWLVANLPGFRHGTGLGSLWASLPLLGAGLLLLSRDRNVRAMWGWLRGRVARQ